MNIIYRESPNYDLRDESCKISMIIIHYTDMVNKDAALARLCEKGSKVSSHYLIDKEGQVFQLVKDDFRAWHAGVSFWDGLEAINNYSLGIELDNNGKEEFSSKQIQSLIELCKNLIKKYNIPIYNVIAHQDIAPTRKNDPGIFFDWQELSKNSIGLWPKEIISDKIPVTKEMLTSKLKEFGYGFSDNYEKIIEAFIIHFKIEDHSILNLYKTILSLCEQKQQLRQKNDY